jgi:hypothetical protein
VPEPPLTPEQAFYTGSHLTGLKMLPISENCEIEISWEAGIAIGTRILESP